MYLAVTLEQQFARTYASNAHSEERRIAKLKNKVSGKNNSEIKKKQKFFAKTK